MSKIRTWGVLAVVIVVAVIAAGWFLALSPQKSKVSKLHASAAQQLQANRGLESQIALLKKQQAQIPAQQAEIAKIQQRIPDTPAMTAYVRTLNALAAKHKVELVSIAPSAPSPVKVATPTAAAAPAAAAPTASPAAAAPTAGAAAPATSANLEVIKVSVSVVGDYYNIQQFLAALEDTSRVTILSSVDLQPGQLPQPQGGTGAAGSTGTSWTTLNASISASVFMSAAPATAATPGAPPAPAANAANK